MANRYGPLPVAAESLSVPVGEVKEGETWRFEANGRWTDWIIPCGPNGYRNFLADVLDIRPRSDASADPKARYSNWFCLMGILDDDPSTIFPIGQGVTKTFARSGKLSVFANDLDKMYKNNFGALSVEAVQLTDALTAVDSMSDERRFAGPVGRWRLIQFVADQGQGVGLVATLVLLVSFLLAGMTQGRDLVRTLAEDGFGAGLGAVGLQLAFCAALLLFAVQAWIWPRMIINSNCGGDRNQWGPGTNVLKWTPRVLGMVPFIAVGIGLATAGDPDAWFLQVLVAFTAVVFFGVILRRKELGNRLGARLGGKTPKAARLGRNWVIASAAMGAIALALFVASPVTLPRHLGAPTVVFLGIGLLIPWLVIISQIGRIFQIPLVPALFALAVVFSLVPALDNHAVGRRVSTEDCNCDRNVAERLSLEQAYEVWKAQAPRDAAGRPVMVLVAAEGGASRAGFWTGEVLTALHERTGGRLAKSLFAISSVSGGSVGALGYAAVLEDNAKTSDKSAIPVGAQLERLTGADALSPTLAGLLFPDLLYRFLPLPFLPDRAEGLERSWEDAWIEGREPSFGLQRSFLRLRPEAGKPWRPILMINGASEETGRRVLTSTILPHVEIEAHDFHALTHRDVAMSTAIHNGARFPYVSPAGVLTRTDFPPERAKGHIIDGGYFDAVGIEALRELATAIVSGPGKDDGLHIVFVVAAYSGAPQAEPGQAKPAGASTRTPNEKPAAPLELNDATIKSKFVLNEILTPARGFLASREGHGYHMARELRGMVDRRTAASTAARDGPSPPPPGEVQSYFYAPVMLCEDKRFRNPMNWALSKRSQDHMRCAAGRKPVIEKECPIQCPVTVKNLKDVAEIINKAEGSPPPATPIPPGTLPSASD